MENVKGFTYQQVREQLAEICRSIKNGYPVNTDYIKEVCNRNGALGREFESWFNDNEDVRELYDFEDDYTFFDSPIVTSEVEQWAMDHPTRLTEESLVRDFLSGPGNMVDDGNAYHEPAWVFARIMKEKRIVSFFRISAHIKKAVYKNDLKLLNQVSGKFWKMSFDKKTSKFLTFDQKAGIVDFLSQAFAKLGVEKEYKAMATDWSLLARELQCELRGHPDDRLKAENPFVEGDEVDDDDPFDY